MFDPGERRFWLLRRFAKVMSVLAWICLVIVLLVVPVWIARAVMKQSSSDFLDAVTYGISGVLIFINLLFIAQLIQVILAVEANTRQSTYVLEKLATLTQQVRDRLGEAGEPGPEVRDTAEHTG